jgi:DNA gyrase subunit B
VPLRAASLIPRDGAEPSVGEALAELLRQHNVTNAIHAPDARDQPY